jgi:CO/xanthine dehydrogenase Mo-binding subunit
MHIVRSPFAHALIKGIETSAAEAADGGEVAVYTAKDIHKNGVLGVPCGWQVNFKNGDTMKETAASIIGHGQRQTRRRCRSGRDCRKPGSRQGCG